MSDTITIRPARVDDVEALAEVHVEGWQWGYRGQLPDAALAAIDVVARQALWRRVLTGEFPDSDVWVAEDGGRVVGFVASGPSRGTGAPEDEGEIYALYVREATAGTSAGHRLLTTAVDALHERGAGSVVLWVLASNERARKFYARAGFAPDGREKTEPWQGVDLREVGYRRGF